jgi:hypothetical protein
VSTAGSLEFTVDGQKVLLLPSSGVMQLWDGVSTYKTVLTTGNAGAQYISVADSGNNFPNAATPKTAETVLANAGSRLAALESTKTNFKVYLSADQSVSANTDFKVPFNTTDYDDLNEFDKTNFKFTCAKAGTYEFIFYAYCNNNAASANSMSAFIKKNGIVQQTVGYATTPANDGVRMLGGITKLKLVVGDVVEAYVNYTQAAQLRGGFINWTSLQGYQLK